MVIVEYWLDEGHIEGVYQSFQLFEEKHKYVNV